jgi:hypothetical protein
VPVRPIVDVAHPSPRGPHIQEVQQAVNSPAKASGHGRIPRVSEVVVAETVRLPDSDPVADGLHDDEDQTDVQLLQDGRGFYAWRSPCVWQLC